MGFDLCIFVYTSVALLRNSTRSGLWHMLFRDGLIYWAVTFCVNSIPAVCHTHWKTEGKTLILGTSNRF